MSLQILPDLVQSTDEWHDQRRGMVTASVVGRLVTYGPPDAVAVACPTCEARPNNPCVNKARKEPTAIKSIHEARTAHAAGRPPVFEVADNETSRGLTATLIAERITGWTDPTYMNDDMWRGVLHEPIARERYAAHNRVTVEEVGFLIRDDWGFQIGASPDGLIGDDGGLEIKCPRAKTHIRTILADEVPAYYMAQVQACLLVSGRKWWDFVSFCGGLPMWTKRVYPDTDWQEAIVAAVAAFERTAEQMMAAYLERVQGLPATERVLDDIEIKVA
jgi:hypothetical protein